MNTYRAFGLNILSDLNFPELKPHDGDSFQPDVKIHARFTEPLEEFEPEYPLGPQRFLFAAKGVGQIVVRHGSGITYLRDAEVDDCTLRLFVLGSCMAALLQQRGHVILHGNAVSIDGKTCRIIVGHSGAGKSTAAAWHYKQGHFILADDVCTIDFKPDGRACVIPSYPQIKLWKASADLLGISTESLRRIRPGAEKFAIPIAEQFCEDPLPIGEIVELSAAHKDATSIHGLDKIRCLKEHSYRFHFLDKIETAPEYMKKLFRLSGLVNVRRGIRMPLERRPEA